MSSDVTVACPQCGHPTRPGLENFCSSCGYPVFWAPAQDNPALMSGRHPDTGTLPRQHPAVGGSPAPGGLAPPGAPPPSSPLPSSGKVVGEIVKVQREPAEVTVAPGGPEVDVTVNVANAGQVVEEFVIDVPDAPQWLDVTAGEAHLLPGTSETVTLRLRMPTAGAVPAGPYRLSVRVRSTVHPAVTRVLPLTVVVPGQEGQLTATIDPQIVRGGYYGRLTFSVTHTGSQPLPVTLHASDAEGAVRIEMSPPWLQLPPFGAAQSQVIVRAPRPWHGQEVTRALTFRADAGPTRSATATASFVQEPLTTDANLTLLRRVLHVLLTLLGSLLMLIGATGVWTTSPLVGRGLAWTYDAYAAVAFNADVPSFAELGTRVPGALASGGIIIVLFALLAAFGVFSPTGRMTRVAAVLATLFLIAFLGVLAFTSGVTTGGGIWTVILGCILAFTGGLLARR